MSIPPLSKLQGYMKNVTDKRQPGKIRHKLEDILFTAVVGTLANAGCWEEIEDFAKGRLEWLRQFVELPGGAPSHDTFERVFKWVDGKEFERCFILWMREICSDSKNNIIALDGKTMRGSGDKQSGRKPLHIVSAWASANNMVLGQVKTDDKSNEITAIPRLLELLDVSGAIVTIDAMGTQKEIAARIIRKNADYVLSVKQNQQTMYEDIELYFEDGIKTTFKDTEKHAYYRTAEKGHGRIEIREYYLVNDIEWASWKKGWSHLGGIGMVKRTVTKGQETTSQKAYFITSLKDNVHSFAEAVRAHWGVESMHWSLDVVLNEDRRIVRKDNGAQNLAVLKRMALNIIRSDQTFEKATGPRKRFRACYDLEYLETVLHGV